MDGRPLRLSTAPLLVSLALLAACAPQPPRAPTEPPVAVDREPGSEVDAALERGDLEQAASLLEQQAREAAVADAPQLLLRAAELRLELDQADSARALLQRVNPELLPSEQRYRQSLLEVRLLLADGQLAAAEQQLAALPAPSAAARPAWLRAEADVAAAAGRMLDAVEARVELEPLLTEAEAQERNRRAIWTLLTEVPMDVLKARMPPPPDRLGGWLELAYLVRINKLEPDNLQSVLQQWQQRYPEHSASGPLLDELLTHYRDVAQVPRQLAVLLPLSGDLAGPAKAVLDGFMAGYYDDPERPPVKVYDIGQGPSQVLTAYQEAINAGSEYVVGPLTKEALLLLTSTGELAAPVLALNTLPDGQAAPQGMHQFALAPEDEAVAAADYAIAQGLRRALVMVPDGQWGARVGAAFERAFTERGGTVLEDVSYDGQGTDFSSSITGALNLDASERRTRQLRGVLKRDVKGEPRRRQDVDVIFMGAFPRAGRLLRPQLRFFDAIDVPVVATSHVYGGDADPADQDLDGVHIVDMPWLLAPQSAPLDRGSLQQLRETALQFPRLFAFGIDAYRLVRHLPLLREHPGDALAGYSGELSLGPDGQIHRRLVPALFRGGEATAVETEQAAFGFRPEFDATR